MNNDAVKMYCKILRGLFQTINFYQGRFLKSYKEMLNEYAILNPKCTYDDLVLRFGTPQEVFIDYLNEQNPDDILKTIRKNTSKKILMMIFIVIVIIGTVSLSVRCYFYYKLYQEVSDSVVTTEEIIVQ